MESPNNITNLQA